MAPFELIGLLFVVVAAFAYINHRFLRWPMTIGVMAISLVFAGLLMLAQTLGLPLEKMAADILARFDFPELLMNGMLAFLLFAGAQHVNLDDLRAQWAPITALATVGIFLSTFLVGSMTYGLLMTFSYEVPFIYCLVFGALISPTDPIAVLSLLKKAQAPKALGAKIAGESLFNDGVGVVVFLIILGIATGQQELTFGNVAILFVKEAIGGAILGLLFGYVAFHLMKSIDNYVVEALITLALVTGGYSVALYLHTSGPIAMVLAGLMIGNQGRAFAMSDVTREHLDNFWLLLDDILNAILFVLLGLELVIVPLTWSLTFCGLVAAVLVLGIRFVSVFIPMRSLRYWRSFPKNTVKVMTWGGLRGGISVALALSLPPSSSREILLGLTFIVVIFSVLVQGLGFGRFMARFPVRE